MLDSTRYWLTVALLSTLPAAVLFWYLIHPFARVWRRLGRTTTYVVVGMICLTVVALLFRVRDQLLGTDLGFHLGLTAVGLLLYLIAAYLEVECRKHLKFNILAGAPELAEEDPGQLLEDGIYGRIRHPRYVSILFGMAGIALFLNYSSMYWMVVALLPAVFVLILLEERELRQRFGQAYVDYSKRVPRFVPRWGRS